MQEEQQGGSPLQVTVEREEQEILTTMVGFPERSPVAPGNRQRIPVSERYSWLANSQVQGQPLSTLEGSAGFLEATLEALTASGSLSLTHSLLGRQTRDASALAVFQLPAEDTLAMLWQ